MVSAALGEALSCGVCRLVILEAFVGMLEVWGSLFVDLTYDSLFVSQGCLGLCPAALGVHAQAGSPGESHHKCQRKEQEERLTSIV
eukprot:19776-Amphidinium_carterae.1